MKLNKQNQLKDQGSSIAVKLLTTCNITNQVFHGRLVIYFFTPQVSVPINVYSGQKPTRLVTTYTTESTSNTTPSVPVMVLVK